jgi:uncharacterized DUF497 family protein
MYGRLAVGTFEWGAEKDRINQSKHGITFAEAQLAFADPKRVIAADRRHSHGREQRYFCFGKTDRGVLTVRFTIRGETIRIFGAGLWREGKRVYESQNPISSSAQGNRECDRKG